MDIDLDIGLNEQASKLIEQIWSHQQKSSVGRLLPGPKGLEPNLKTYIVRFAAMMVTMENGNYLLINQKLTKLFRKESETKILFEFNC